MPTNRLAREKSPYLLQHAHNPVDWFPWGDEAFEKARREDKPVFLSIGYSTCHWCHVMERESFENEEIARVLNENFVSIKVDREERPDVDRVYMLFVQASTGGGGWPMSVWLTPERKPFFGGTYFPPDNRWGRAGFKTVLERLADAWKRDRARIEATGADVLTRLNEYASLGDQSGASKPAGAHVLEHAFWNFRRSFDSRLGGFGGAPKFPRPSVHNFLVRYHHSSKNHEALDMVTATLTAMEKGGMNDQLGGGFHRYSVDARWFVPHFEKMLYDQAQLAVSYLEAFQITRDGRFASAARDIFDYVLRDMTGPEGEFYSAEDADSVIDPAHPHEKGEGAFYIWSAQEIRDTLGERDSAIFAFRFGVEENGNVQEDPHGEFRGRNILYQARTVEETAAHFNLPEQEIRAILSTSCKKLLEIRAQRPRPLRDDKVLAAWNGMMISAFAKAAQVLGELRYAEAARRAADFVRRHLWDDARSILLRRHREGESAVDGFLDDYAFMGLALLDLYETAFNPADLDWAIRLAERAIGLFEDTSAGGFFSSASPDLVLKLKDDYDGAEPSGNSAMAMLLLRLARMTGRGDFRSSADRTLAAFRSRLEEAGTGLPQMLAALWFSTQPPMEIVIASPVENRTDRTREIHGENTVDDTVRNTDLHQIFLVIRRHFLPQAVVLLAEHAARVRARRPAATDSYVIEKEQLAIHPMPAVDGRATVYVCENFACKLPVTTIRELEALLE